MTIGALHEIPRLRHVSDSLSTYENSLIPIGGFPPIPVLERYDAGPNRVRLKERLTNEITDSAARAHVARAIRAAVTAFSTPTEMNFMQFVINPLLRDLPFQLNPGQ
ncbi:MAG: hypothetical protein ACI9S8_002745 [Chlamydiales bacterium]|jgi:hypothetical protein